MESSLPTKTADPDRRLETATGWVSLVAGLIHGVAAPAHFEAWWGYGLFFVFAAMAQMLLGLALLTRAINPKEFGQGWRTAKRTLYVAGIVGNLLIMGLYLVTRTRGIPFGPEQGLVEEVGALDVASKIAEAIVIFMLAALLQRSMHKSAS